MTPESIPVRPTPADGAASRLNVDWHAAEESPEFQELVKKRRAFVIPALAFVFVWYFGFIALAGYAPDFMGESVYEGVTIGYMLALSQFVMTWALAWLYLRRAERVFDPLAEAAAKRALGPGSSGATPRADDPAPRRGNDEVQS